MVSAKMVMYMDCLQFDDETTKT
ncbi:hypothetical protein THIOKS11510004 [Thiocapsa sp. KS1]|nr:hypothetical protein THIOKS11510004 [Thiocapsa sp. KS1]